MVWKFFLLISSLTTMLRRAASKPTDITALSQHLKATFCLNQGLPQNIFNEDSSLLLGYGKKVFSGYNRERFQVYATLYNHTDPEVVEQLRFLLMIHRQFQSSIFSSESFRCFKNETWTFFAQKHDFLLLKLDKNELKPFERIKQYFLSLVEAHRILELNNAVFSNLHDEGSPCNLEKGEAKLNVLSLAGLHQSGSRTYLNLNHLSEEEIEEKSSISSIVRYKSLFLYRDIMNMRYHRLSLATLLFYDLFSVYAPDFPEQYNIENDAIFNRFQKLKNFVKACEQVCYTWAEMREFVDSFGMKGRLANLIEEREEISKNYFFLNIN